MADSYLVDTSVFVRWYIEQDGFEHAQRVQSEFRAGSLLLETVDCVRFELGHVLRTHGYCKNRITREEYLLASRSLDDAGVVIHTTGPDDLQRSAAIAADWNLKFFDAVLAERALQRGLTLLTSDLRLCNAVSGKLPTELLEGVK